MKSAILIALVTLAPLQAAGSTQSAAWAPTGKWVVRFDEDKCAAIRQYTRGNELLQLDLRPTPIEKDRTINIEAPGGAARYNPNLEVTVLVDGQAVPAKKAYMAPSARSGRTIYSAQLDPTPVQQLRRANRLTFASGQSAYDIPLPDMPIVANALDVCVADLLRSIGFTDAEQARLASPPRPVAGRLDFSHNDYPAAAINRGSTGRVTMVLRIDADGSLKSCTIQKASGDVDLDRASCNVARRTRFFPARDRAGQPMEAPYFTYISWSLG